jgi:hypothetical protein
MLQKINELLDYFSENNKRYYISLSLVAFALGFLTTLFFCYSVSPLYLESNGFGEVSSTIKVLGYGMRNGLKPYVDLAENSGPYLFYYALIGAWMHKSIGFYLLQSICTSVAIFSVLDLGRNLGLGRRSIGLFTFFFLLIYLINFEGTIVSDSFMWAYLLPVNFVVKGVMSKNDVILARAIFLDGLILGILLFTRPIDIFIPASVGLFIIVYTIVNKCKIKLPKYILLGLSGAVITSGFVMLLTLTGGYFSEMIDYTFVKNFAYTGRMLANNDSMKLLCVMMSLETTFAIVCLLMAFKNDYPKELKLFMMVILPLYLAYGCVFFIHITHFKVFLPLYLLALGFPLRYFDMNEIKYKRFVQYVIAIVTFFGLIIYAMSLPSAILNSTSESGAKSHLKLVDLKEYMDSKDKEGDFLAIDTVPNSYLVLDRVPKYRIFTKQTEWKQKELYDNLYDELNNYLKDKVTYLIIKEDSLILDYDPFLITLRSKFEYKKELSYFNGDKEIWSFYERKSV